MGSSHPHSAGFSAIFGVLVSTAQRTEVGCSQDPSLWYFVLASAGYEYTESRPGTSACCPCSNRLSRCPDKDAAQELWGLMGTPS